MNACRTVVSCTHVFSNSDVGLTPRMCGVGDAITTGTNADTGTNLDREYVDEIAARPRRPYHAFVSPSPARIETH